MDNNKETKKVKKNNIELIIIVVVIVLVVFLGTFLIFKKGDDAKVEEKKPHEDKGTPIVENDIVEAYGMKADDAVELVKSIYNSDNFSYSAAVSKDAKYIVTVTNTITNVVYKYEVDPISKSFYEIN